MRSVVEDGRGVIPNVLPENNMETPTRPKRKRRFRFSLRVMVVLTFLFAIYFAHGPATRTTGVKDVKQLSDRSYTLTRPLAPLLIERRMVGARFTPVAQKPEEYCRTEYFIWIHGYVLQLPFKGEETRQLTPGVSYSIHDTPEHWFPSYSW